MIITMIAINIAWYDRKEDERGARLLFMLIIILQITV